MGSNIKNISKQGKELLLFCYFSDLLNVQMFRFEIVFFLFSARRIPLPENKEINDGRFIGIGEFIRFLGKIIKTITV